MFMSNEISENLIEQHHNYAGMLTRSEQFQNNTIHKISKGEDSEPLTIQFKPSQYTYEAPLSVNRHCRTLILPHNSNNHENAKVKMKIYQQELLEQIQLDRMRKYQERNLEIQNQRKMDIEFMQHHPIGSLDREIELRDIYGNTIMSRKSENMIKLEEKQSKLPRLPIQNNKAAFKEIFSCMSELSPADVLVKKFKDCHSHLRAESRSNLPQVTRSEATFARGGHGIFGQPLSDFEKKNKMKYQEELLEQMKFKREQLEAEREKEKVEEEILRKQIEEHEIQSRREELEREQEGGRRLKRRKKSAGLLEYQGNSTFPMESKRQDEAEKKDHLTDDKEVMTVEDEKFINGCPVVPERRFKKLISYQDEMKSLDRMEFQEQLLKQIQEKLQEYNEDRLKELQMAEEETSDSRMEKERMNPHHVMDARKNNSKITENIKGMKEFKGKERSNKELIIEEGRRRSIEEREMLKRRTNRLRSN